MKISHLGGAQHIWPGGDVAKIEVEDIVPPDADDDSLIPVFYRTIRITCVDNEEVLEIFCTATSEQALQVKSVRELGKVERPAPDLMNPLAPAKRKRVE